MKQAVGDREKGKTTMAIRRLAISQQAEPQREFYKARSTKAKCEKAQSISLVSTLSLPTSARWLSAETPSPHHLELRASSSSFFTLLMFVFLEAAVFRRGRRVECANVTMSSPHLRRPYTEEHLGKHEGHGWGG
jgi:hypothetical protein